MAEGMLVKNLEVQGSIDPMETIQAAAKAFEQRLNAIQARVNLPEGLGWYPWSTSITNLWCMAQLLTGENRALFSDMKGKRVADIGGADGDMAFFMESLGASAELIDWPPTSNNKLMGARTFKRELNSAVTIREVDVDTQFEIPGRFDLVMLLGILYHLKNPYYALEHIGKLTDHLIISTKVTAYTHPASHPDRAPLRGPVAFLLFEGQAFGDPTNYWVFSEEGLRLLVKRTGWALADSNILGGDMETSDPYTKEGDRRMWCYLRR